MADAGQCRQRFQGSATVDGVCRLCHALAKAGPSDGLAYGIGPSTTANSRLSGPLKDNEAAPLIKYDPIVSKRSSHSYSAAQAQGHPIRWPLFFFLLVLPISN